MPSPGLEDAFLLLRRPARRMRLVTGLAALVRRMRLVTGCAARPAA